MKTFKIIILIVIIALLGGVFYGFYVLSNGFSEDVKTFTVDFEGKQLSQKDTIAISGGIKYTFNVNSIKDLVGQSEDISVNIVPNTTLGNKYRFAYYLEGIDNPKNFYDIKSFNKAFDLKVLDGVFTIELDKNISLTSLVQSLYAESVIIPYEINYYDVPYFLINVYNSDNLIYSISVCFDRLPSLIEMQGVLTIG